MSVSNYIQPCGYLLEELDDVVFLFKESHAKYIHIDSGEAYIDRLTTQPLALEAYNINVTEEDSLDERYRFTHGVRFIVHGYADINTLGDRYYVVLRTRTGNYLMLNPEFPCSVSYTYTLDRDKSETTFNLSTVSNHPILPLHWSGENSKTCRYFKDSFDGLLLNEKDYSTRNGTHISYSNDGFKTVIFNKGSQSYTEEFDGSNLTATIDFDINLDDYKRSWAYELLEFINNRYSAVIKTKNGSVIMGGFDFGFQPSFALNGDSNEHSTISIKLVEMVNGTGLDGRYSTTQPDYSENTAAAWVYTDEHDGFVCTQSGLAQYLLQKEINFLGNPTGRYKVLAGYEDMFPDLNIVGTFSDAVYFQTDKCGDGGGGGMTGGTLPDVIDLQSGECKSFTFSAVCDWNVSDSSSDLTITPTSGVANRLYTITVCRDVESPTCDVTLSNYEPIICLHEGYLEGGRKVYSGATTITGVSSCGMYGSHGASAWEDGFSSQSTGIEDHSPNMAVPITIVHVIGYDNEDYDRYLSRDHEGSFNIKDADGNVIYTITATIRYCGGNNPGGGTWDDE